MLEPRFGHAGRFKRRHQRCCLREVEQPNCRGGDSHARSCKAFLHCTTIVLPNERDPTVPRVTNALTSAVPYASHRSQNIVKPALGYQRSLPYFNALETRSLRAPWSNNLKSNAVEITRIPRGLERLRARFFFALNTKLKEIAKRMPVPPVPTIAIRFLLCFSFQPFSLVLIDDILTAPQVGFVRVRAVCLLDDLPAHNHYKIERNPEIAGLRDELVAWKA